ncbi:unnamed protein product [Caenorhabditis sp. 36 PRJEB53466]|nr:unnamed protein product [Caenorhabditis sp. 36 PRJEB53466]
MKAIRRRSFMSDGASTSAAQPPQTHAQEAAAQRSPDLMDNDPLLVNLKALHEETKSDVDDEEPHDEADGGPKKCSPSDGIVVHMKKSSDPGRFMWIWTLGIKCPSLSIDGEPYMPIEIVDDVLAKESLGDAIFFQDLLRNKNVYVRICTQEQFNAVESKSEVCRQLKLTSMSMMSRSDIERIMGELRRESRPTKCEHDDWDDEYRVHVVHANFIDYNENWLEDNSDLEEDALESGTHGFWYKNRHSMRCIVCRECGAKFTPPDFIMHHHYPIPAHGLAHIGCNPSAWGALIEVHKDSRTADNVEAWDTFSNGTQLIGKKEREYADAEPQARRDKLDKYMTVDEEEGELIRAKKIKRVSNNPNDDIDMCKQNGKLHIADFLGPSGSKGLKPKNKLEEIILDSLNNLDEHALEMLLLKEPEEFFMWIKEMDFAKKVRLQEEQWKAKLKDPNYRPTGSAVFDPRKSDFVNMHEYENAPKSTKLEIQQLAANFARLHQEAEKGIHGSCWETMKLEKALLKSLSPDALRVLNNQPLPKMHVQPMLPIFPNLNLLQLAQQIMGSGGVTLPKLMIPMGLPTPVQTPVLTPVTPTTPLLHTPIPMVPAPPSTDFLLKQLSLLSSNPALFPMTFFPKIPMEQLSNQLNQILKATKTPQSSLKRPRKARKSKWRKKERKPKTWLRKQYVPVAEELAELNEYRNSDWSREEKYENQGEEEEEEEEAKKSETDGDGEEKEEEVEEEAAITSLEDSEDYEEVNATEVIRNMSTREMKNGYTNGLAQLLEVHNDDDEEEEEEEEEGEVDGSGREIGEEEEGEEKECADTDLKCPGNPCPRGPPGPPGLPGPPGENADDGVDGNNGTEWELLAQDRVIILGCVKCPAGPRGIEGDPGPPGDKGGVGKPGQPGLDGYEGFPGPSGPEGEGGYDGENGPNGWPGPRGEDSKIYRNLQGPPGPTGVFGPPGEYGEQGNVGSAGAEGIAGVTGAPGEHGIPGPPGAPGLPGEAGISAALLFSGQCKCPDRRRPIGGGNPVPRPYYQLPYTTTESYYPSPEYVTTTEAPPTTSVYRYYVKAGLSTTTPGYYPSPSEEVPTTTAESTYSAEKESLYVEGYYQQHNLPTSHHFIENNENSQFEPPEDHAAIHQEARNK